MADDIDIEEHDLPSNPRMRGYFPAMDIKEEPDDNDDEYNSDTSGSINYEYKTSPQSSTDNFTNYDNNRIILGSKPSSKPLNPILADNPQSNSEQFDPKLMLKAAVSVDDWSERLTNSPCYCGECETLFATRNALDAHKTSAHSYLVAMEAEEPERVPISKWQLCRHCNNYFVDEAALIKHMYQIIDEKSEPKATETKNDKTAAKGQIAGTNESNEIAAVAKRAVAVKRTGKVIRKSEIVKSVADRVTDDMVIDVIQDKSEIATQKGRAVAVKHTARKTGIAIQKRRAVAVKHTARSELITKNIPGNSKSQSAIAPIKNETANAFGENELCYSCPICSCVYKYINNMNAHTEENHSSIFDDHVLVPFQAGCKICNKSTVIETHNSHIKHSHQKQFNKKVGYFSTLKPCEETSAVSRKVTCVRRKPPPDREVLYICVECKTEYVNYCSAMTHNRTYHPEKRESLIYVGPEKNFPIYRGVPQYKRWMPKDVIFKCADCPLHFLNSMVTMIHSSKHLSNSLSRNTYEWWVCPECNKTFRKTDQYNHEMQHDYDGEIRCYEYHKEIYPQVLCRCKCNVYLEERVFFKHYKHGCIKTPSELCQKCNIRVKDYAVHLQRHRTLKSDFILIHEFITRANVDGTDDSVLDDATESMQNESDTESNNQISREVSHFEDKEDNFSMQTVESNKRKTLSDSDVEAKKVKLYDEAKTKILYKCEACQLFTDSYDSVIEHSQKHIINIIDHERDVRQCKTCSLKFEDKCLNDHKNPRKVKILPYKYENLFKDTWLGFLSSLSKDEVDDITSKSKYVTLAVKMNMILDGLPKLTMYKCVSCKNYVDPSIVFKHTHECDSVAGNFECESCGIMFSCSTGLKNHEKIHENDNISANSYRIVTFNNKMEKAFNLNLKKVYESSCVDSEDEFERDQLRDSIVFKSVTFYQCLKCKLCSDSRELITKHQCLDKSVIRKCPKCDYVTSSNFLPNHIRWHSKNIHVTRVAIEIVQSGEDTDKTREHVYFQCKDCDVLLINKQHDCGNIVKEKCLDCNYIFSGEGIRFHRQRHTDDKKMTRESITVVPFKGGQQTVNKEGGEQTVNKDKVSGSETMYKCTSCKCIFLTKLDFCRHYRRMQCYFNKGHKCAKCGLVFHIKGINAHKEQQRNGICIPPNIVTLNRAGIKDYTLFKCDKCKIHFVNRATFRLHIKRGHNNARGKRCRKCDLRFGKGCFSLHISMHHEKGNYKTEDYNIVCPKLKKIEASDDRTEGSEDMKTELTNVTNRSETEVSVRRSERPKVPKKPFDQTENVFEAFDNENETENDEKVEEYINRSQKIASASNITLDNTSVDVAHKKVVSPEKSIPKNVSSKKNPGIYRNIEYDNKLLKCSSCGVHFLKRSTFYLHLGAPCRSPKNLKSVTCPKCQLVFTQASLKRHINIHHQIMKLNAKDLKVIEHTKDDEEKDTIQCIKKTHIGERCDRTNTVYKCAKCNHYYLTKVTMCTHIKNKHKTTIAILKCNICGLNFTKYTLPKHKYIHHDTFGYQPKDLHIFEVAYSSKSKVKVKSENTELPVDTPTASNDILAESEGDNLDIIDETDEDSTAGDFVSILDKSGVNKITITRKENASKDKKIIEQHCVVEETETRRGVRNVFDCIDLEDEDENSLDSTTSSVVFIQESDITGTPKEKQSDDDKTLKETNSNINAAPTKEQKAERDNEFKLYKCGECNVYFIEHNTCYEHMSNHTPLDSYDNIECKLCTLQFQIEHLKKHIQIHHKKDFNLDKVLVDVYKLSHGEPKCETYYATDKLQSRLVSTTTDDRKDRRTGVITANQVKTDTEINVAGNTSTKDKTSKLSDDESTMSETGEKLPFEIKNEIKTELDESPAILNITDVASTSKTTTKLKTYSRRKPTPQNQHACKFCTERFASNRAKELHESLDHWDAMKECPICAESFNESILHELHLNMKGGEFTCCVCKRRRGTDKLQKHIGYHNGHYPYSRYLALQDFI